MSARVCVFCLRCEPESPACTYGLGHEFPPTEPVKQAPRRDPKLCARCGMHPRNPAYAASGCAHEHAP